MKKYMLFRGTELVYVGDKIMQSLNAAKAGDYLVAHPGGSWYFRTMEAHFGNTYGVYKNITTENVPEETRLAYLLLK